MQDQQQALFSAQVREDRDIGTSIDLTYTDHDHAERSLRASIAPKYGSNLYSLQAGEHNLIYCDKEILKARGFTGNFVCWPFPNRVRDKSYTWRGSTYSLSQVTRPEGNSVLIHGLVFDRPWNYDEPSVDGRGACVRTFIDIAPDSPYFDAYPFPSRLSLTYTLSADGLLIAYTVENQGQQPLPYGFALHPYFSVLGRRETTRVSINSTSVMEADDDLLPTGRVLDTNSVMYAMFDLRQSVPVSALKLDHVYTAVASESSGTIAYPHVNLALHLRASDDFTHMVIFTLGGDDFLCLENQTCTTDAINLAETSYGARANLREVAPGAMATGFIEYVISHT